ncbi:DUF2764 family protein [Massilibacteroides sp.]|uniref:DUF2764 family protein n=1 Tax=Massilibacteroides sp. TaxID=2034766 RepID=UPI00260FE560|nr:DUF2764 family protein [Massilibacteroides sp.]MDD4515995.1 DUF2764 family protein [Massilibacteroides sp.]
MSKYHCLIAGLPDITLDDSKQVYSVQSFKEETYPLLSRKDRKLFDLFFLKYDNQNLLCWINNPTEESISTFDIRATISPDQFIEFAKTYEAGEKIKKNIPSYIINFLKSYFIVDESTERENAYEEDSEQTMLAIAPEDSLAALYYSYAMKQGNTFFSDWFEFNLTIKNILTAVTCIKHGLDRNLYVVGENSIAENLRKSNAKDFDLGDDFELLPELLRLAEETDLVEREKKIDLLKWEWLDENTIFKTFGIESVFAYLLKIEMIERWTGLDKASGEATFRELIDAMKKDSNEVLNEFKKKNNTI